MAELNTLLNDVHTNLEVKIKELYESKLKEHMENISCRLSNAYTKDYGKLDIDKLHHKEIVCELKTIEQFLKTKNRYIIHFIYNTNQHSRIYYIFDNYGNYLSYKKNYNNYGNYEKKYEPSYCQLLHKYVLPNILIDLIKTFNNTNIQSDYDNLIYDIPVIQGGWCYYNYINPYNNTNKTSLLKQIKLIAEDYYNRFMIDKPFIDENKKLIEENNTLIEENKKLVEENQALKSLTKSTSEIETQTESFINNDYKYDIKNNVLTIFYYNHDELNLCDFLPLIKKDIEINKDGKTIIIKDCNCTNIERVTIICSNFKKITKYYQGIKHLQIMSCDNQKIDIPKYLRKDLLIFTIDGKNQ